MDEVTPPAAPNRNRFALVLLATMVVGLATYVLTSMWPPAPPAKTAVSILDDPDNLVDPVAVNPGYVGARACAPCHAERTGNFLQTRHAVACIGPRDDQMPAGFNPGKNRFQTYEATLHYEMKREVNSYFQSAVKTVNGQAKRTDHPVGFIYGSGGELDEVFFSWEGDRLLEMPVAWLHPQGCWGHVNISRQSPDPARAAGYRCLECHNVWFENIPSADGNRYKKDSFILGVGCEHCHGPARDHVEFHETNPAEKAGQKIVKPRELTRERKIDLCAQCHGNGYKNRGPARSFRAGDAVDDHFRVGASRVPEEDHVANQTKYMKESKCYQESEDLTCTTCHNPHKKTDRAAVRDACSKCHGAADCKEQPKLPEGVRADCAGCHMPARAWMNVHFHTEAEPFVPPIRRYQHRIAVDPVATQDVLREWYLKRADAASQGEAAKLTQSLSAHWLKVTDDRAKAHRYTAAIESMREGIRVAPTAENRSRLKQLLDTQLEIYEKLDLGISKIATDPSAARKLIESVLALQPTNATATGRLGMIEAQAGNKTAAMELWEKVAKLDPDDSYGENLIGWQHYLNGQYGEAIAAFQRADAIEPFDLKIHYNWGLALFQLGRFEEAAAKFRVARTIDPEHAGIHDGLAAALLKLGRPREALDYAKRAAKLTKYENAYILENLADAYAAAGDPARTRDALERALAAAKATSPNSVVGIQTKLAKLAPPAK